MNKSRLICQLSILPILFFLGCSQNSAPGLVVPGQSRAKAEDQNIISVLDTDGSEIPNAKILIGNKVDDPFKNNLLTTDIHGKLTPPVDWKTTETLSIQATGFVSASFLHSTPGGHIFKLRKQVLKNELPYSGASIGYPPFDDRSVGHVSLVFPALERQSLIDFNLGQLLSSESDNLSILGTNYPVPSNLAIPNQTISYIISINISKPQFRIPLQVNQNHLMVGLQAHFPVTDLVRGVRAKKSIFDMINLFEFASFTTQDVRIDNLAVSRDLDISQTPIGLKNHIQAQKFDPNLVMISISSLEKDQKLIPLDIKKLDSGASQDLNTLTTDHKSEKNIAVLKVKATAETAVGAAQEFMSIAVHDAALNHLPAQLEILSAPKASLTQIDQSLPMTINKNIASTGMYYSLSQVTANASTGVSIESKDPIWDVYNPNWETQATLPTLPQTFLTMDSLPQRWSISVLGVDQAPVSLGSDLGPDRLKEANYISRTAVDLK